MHRFENSTGIIAIIIVIKLQIIEAITIVDLRNWSLIILRYSKEIEQAACLKNGNTMNVLHFQAPIEHHSCSQLNNCAGNLVRLTETMIAKMKTVPNM